MQNIMEKVQNLPSEFQSNLAFFWEQELESEMGFDNKISNTADKLKKIADQAILEFNKGETINIGFDKL
jgi:hypothetical protein